MASGMSIAEAFVTLRPDLSKFESEAKSGLSGVLGGLGNLAGMAAKAFVGIGAAAAGAGTLAVKASLEEEQSIIQVAQAAKQAGVDWEKQGSSVDKAIMGWQRMSAVSHDEIRPAFALMIAQTGSLEEAMTRMPYALDLARGGNIDLATASRLLGKVSDETTSVLARMGIVIKKGATEADVFAAVQQKFGGQAAEFAKTGLGGWQAMKNELDEVVEGFGYALMPLFKEGIGLARDFIRGFTEGGGLKSFTDGIGIAVQIVKEFFGVLTGSAPDAGAVLTSILGPDAAAFIMQGLALIRDYFMTVFGAIGGILEGFRTGNWQPLLDTLGQGALSIGERLGGIMQAIGGFIGRLIEQLIAAAPSILESLGKWAQAFLAWIAPMIPPFLAYMGTLIGQLIEWVGAQVPKIVEKIKEWAQAFIAWVGPQIPVLLGEALKFLRSLIDWVGAHAGEIGDKLGEWAEQFISWVVDTAVPGLIENLPSVLVAILGFVSEALPKIAGALISFGRGFIGHVMEGIEHAKTDLWNAVVGIGQDVASGLWSGLQSMAGWLAGMIWGWIKRVIPDVIQDFLGIGSPSKLMAEIGGDVAAGLAEGIGDGTSDVVTSMEGLTDSLLTTTKDGLKKITAAWVPKLDADWEVSGQKIPQFHGGGVMPWTGLAKLEKGERVSPPAAADPINYDKLALAIARAKIDERNQEKQISLSVQIEGREIARAEAEQNTQEARRFGYTTGVSA